MSRFAVFAAAAYLFNASIIIWNVIDIFNVGGVLADNTNTLPGIMSQWFCTSNGTMITSCSNDILVITGIFALGLFASGFVTLIAFGNTYQAFVIFLSIIPALMTLYTTVAGILDVFGVGSIVAGGIGGMFAIIFSLFVAWGAVEIQAKIHMGP